MKLMRLKGDPGRPLCDNCDESYPILEAHYFNAKELTMGPLCVCSPCFKNLMKAHYDEI